MQGLLNGNPYFVPRAVHELKRGDPPMPPKVPAVKPSDVLKRPVVPDRLDLRDRPYIPAISRVPEPELAPVKLPVLHQGQTSACTGFALATVVHALLRKRDAARAAQVSPFMIYSMARRYDEFPGYTADSGSSLRGAMKGWYKHGVCNAALWTAEPMPPAAATAAQDWWLDAARRPLGAYYRVDPRSVTDMHVALNEVGILYASALCHGGWDEGTDAKKPKQGLWAIPYRKAEATDGGHAFAIVGYTRDGFIVHNSWGTAWGSGGLAVLTYEDWAENAMDCWVAQLGVETSQHRDIAGAISLRVTANKVQLAGDTVLRNRELSPFIINMENNGRLSNSGQFRTSPGDIHALMTVHLPEARKRWNLGPKTPVDIAIYAHGGLVGENAAAETAAKWIPALYDRKVFPIFLMWETDIFSTIKNRLSDLITGQPRPAGGIGDMMRRFWDTRVERLLVGPGSLMWGEMKQNAERISGAADSGGRLLFDASQDPAALANGPYRLHLIGHSAGSIVHSYIVDRLCAMGMQFESVSFMAPAVRLDTFDAHVYRWLKKGEGAASSAQGGIVRRYAQYHLSDAAEQTDRTCSALLLYSRSLLYLVAQSFEGGAETPILGMEKYASKYAKLKRLSNATLVPAPGGASNSSTHGGFDDDAATMKSVIAGLK
jgi:hypothetical protein